MHVYSEHVALLKKFSLLPPQRKPFSVQIYNRGGSTRNGSRCILMKLEYQVISSTMFSLNDMTVKCKLNYIVSKCKLNAKRIVVRIASLID